MSVWRNLCGVVLFLATAAAALGESSVKTPIALHAGPHLLIDEHLVASQSNVQRRLEHPARLSDPVVTGAEDKNFQPFVSVLRDPASKHFRMWYGVPAHEQQSLPSHLAYMESPDGIHWQRPHRVLNDPGGLEVRFGASVIDDGPDFPDPSQRYKFAWNFGDFVAPSGMMIATSPDGFAWTPISKRPPVLLHTHDINNLYHDRVRNRYLATVNMLEADPVKGNLRRTFQSTSEDLLHWTRPHEIIPPDARDEGDFQYYGMSGYLARGELLIGLVKVLRDDLPAEAGGEARGIGYTALAWSRDGVQWEREREPFLDRNPTSGTWDRAMSWGDCQLEVGPEVFIYYGGYKRGHKVERYTERQIGLARLPRDRYVARVAGATPGVLTTPPLLLEAKSISINANLIGELRARLLDAQDKPLAGFDFADCDPVHGNAVRAAVRWKRSIGELNGQAVSLQFQWQDGSLYAFELHAEKDPPAIVTD